jgi:hypothetical protein
MKKECKIRYITIPPIMREIKLTSPHRKSVDEELFLDTILK